jgi:hypothetical protein
MNNDPFSYLHRSGIMSSGIKKGAERTLKVKTVSMAVKRPPEFPSQTPSGPREGHKVSGKRPGGDGWKPGVNAPARVGKEYAGVQAESPGGNKAKAASPARGVEQKSATSDANTHAAKRVSAKKANIEGNESAKYEKLEKKTLRSLAKGGSSKEKRAGHNLTRVAPTSGYVPGGARTAPTGSLQGYSTPVAPRPPQRTVPPKPPLRAQRPNVKHGRMATRRG